MAETKTNWILELIDRITAPMKNVAAISDTTADIISDITANINKMDATGQEAANHLIKNYKALQNELSDTEQFLQELKQSIAETNDEKSLQVLIKAYKEQRKSLKDIKNDLSGVEEELRKIDAVPIAETAKKNWGEMSIAINQTMELAQKFSESLDFAQELSDLKTTIELFSGATGDALNEMTKRAYKIGKEYNDSAEEVVKAANAMSKQMGITFNEAFNLIEAGYKKGANLNGGMLEDLKEFSTQFEQAGITGSNAIALMVQAGKQGVFNNKAIDSIKEANLSLREMGQAQIDALTGIGLKVKDLAGKTTIEAVQMISKAMDGKSVQAQQKVITDIFRGAGEDAGLAWIKGLSGVNMDINSLPNVERAGNTMRSFLSDIEVWFSDSMGGIAITFQQLSGPMITMLGFIPILQGLQKVTWLNTIATTAWGTAQTFLNAAFLDSPIGWIVLGIGAITAGVVYAWNTFEGFRASIYGIWEASKQVFNNVGDLFKRIFAPVVEAITAFKEGRYADVAKAVGKTMINLSPVGIAYQTAQWASDGGATKGVKDAFNRGSEAGRESFRKDKAADGTKADTIDGSVGSRKGSVLDGKSLSTGNNSANAGMSISGGGGKSISMRIEIKNYFQNVKSDLDLEKAANKIAAIINDRVNDNLITNV